MSINNGSCLHCSSTESLVIDISEANFQYNAELVKLVDCYTFITGIKIESEINNSKICQLCQFQLQSAYTFKQKFLPIVVMSEVKVEQPVYEESIYVCAIQDQQYTASETMQNTSSTSDLQLQCPICLKVAINQVALEYHQNMHNPRHASYCRFCNTEMPDKVALMQHFEEFHEFFECVVCGQKFESVLQMKRHQTKKHLVSNAQDQLSAVCTDGRSSGKKSTRAVRHTCVICKKEYATLRSLISHEKFMHNPNLEKLSCPFCQNKIKYEQHLKKHIRIFHPEEVKNYVAIQRKSPTPIDEYKCVVCQDTFGLISLLYVHQRDSHTVNVMDDEQAPAIAGAKNEKFQCPICGVIICDKSSQSHQELHENKKLQCMFCPRVCKTNGNLKRHTLTCHPGKKIGSKPDKSKKHPCDECGNIYIKKSSLADHKRIHLRATDEMTKFECNHCHAMFRNSRGLICHIKRRHAENCFKCTEPMCEAILADKEALEAHGNLHNSSSACECLVCRENFQNYFDLYQHYEVGHRLQNKTYKSTRLDNCRCCCGVNFATMNLFKIHVVGQNSRCKNTRPILNCELCDRKFRSDKVFAQHLYEHKGYDPFVCVETMECLFKTKHENIFRDHLKKEHNRDFEEDIHGFDESKAMEKQKKHEAKPNPKFIFKCNECPKRYRFNSSLHRHVQIVHKQIKCVRKRKIKE